MDVRKVEQRREMITVGREAGSNGNRPPTLKAQIRFDAIRLGKANAELMTFTPCRHEEQSRKIEVGPIKLLRKEMDDV